MSKKLSQKPTRLTSLSPPSRTSLPQLPDHHFNHAIFDSVVLGPRRELTLGLRPLVWAGHQGHHGPAVTVRFGGIVNIEEVKALFEASHHEHSELSHLDYDKQYASKPGDLYLRIEFERVEAQIVIHCHSLTIMEPNTEKAA